MQTGPKIAFVNLWGRQYRTYSIVYRPQLMKLMFLGRLDPNAICNPLSITKSTVTCTLKNTVLEGVKRCFKLNQGSHLGSPNTILPISLIYRWVNKGSETLGNFPSKWKGSRFRTDCLFVVPMFFACLGSFFLCLFFLLIFKNSLTECKAHSKNWISAYPDKHRFGKRKHQWFFTEIKDTY